MEEEGRGRPVDSGMPLPSDLSLHHAGRLSCSALSDSFVTLWTVACQAPLSWNSPGKNAGVGCHFLLQGLSPTQG